MFVGPSPFPCLPSAQGKVLFCPETIREFWSLPALQRGRGEERWEAPHSPGSTGVKGGAYCKEPRVLTSSRKPWGEAGEAPHRSGPHGPWLHRTRPSSRNRGSESLTAPKRMNLTICALCLNKILPACSGLK